VRALPCFALVAILATSEGFAKTACVPSRTLTTAPRGVSLVGQSGMPDIAGTVTYVVRDAAGIVVPGSIVWLDLSRCADVRLASDAVAPNTIVDCSRRSVQGVADVSGTVTFRIVGSGGGAPRTDPTCASAYADGVPLPAPIVSVYDLDGMNGVNGIDLSIATCDLFSGQYRPRCDYDADGDVDGIDIGLMARVLYGGGSQASGLPCPP